MIFLSGISLEKVCKSFIELDNNKLKRLYCSNNKLKILVIKNNANITYLSCGNNMIQELNIEK